jgi:hypothetical protein
MILKDIRSTFAVSLPCYFLTSLVLALSIFYYLIFRDFPGVLSVLSSEYNIEKFIRLYVEALIDYR